VFSLLQEIDLCLVSILQVLAQVLLHSLEFADALLESINVLFLKAFQMLSILLEALVDDLPSWLGERVLMVIGHLKHQIQDLLNLSSMGLSHISNLFFCLLNVNTNLVSKVVY
jgi:hypothetical protein